MKKRSANRAAVNIKNTRNLTSKAVDCFFRLNVSPAGDQSLSEIVVTAFGYPARKEGIRICGLYGYMKDLELRPEGDLTRVLNGKTPGVNILNTSGLSGSRSYYNVSFRRTTYITCPFTGGMAASYLVIQDDWLIGAPMV
jgi:hypothetical protein